MGRSGHLAGGPSSAPPFEAEDRHHTLEKELGRVFGGYGGIRPPCHGTRVLFFLANLSPGTVAGGQVGHLILFWVGQFLLPSFVYMKVKGVGERETTTFLTLTPRNSSLWSQSWLTFPEPGPGPLGPSPLGRWAWVLHPVVSDKEP